jgi:hypothetical protein
MICTQCKTDLPAFVTSCPRCGAPVSPVPFYSYLPEGTPAWPSAVQIPHLQANVDRAIGSRPVVDASLSASEIARPAPAMRRARSWLVTIALLILSSLLGSGVVLASLWSNGYFARQAAQRAVTIPSGPSTTSIAGTSQTGSNVLPTPSSFKPLSQASSQSLGLTLSFPGDWQEGTLTTGSDGSKTLVLQPPASFSIPLGLFVAQWSNQDNIPDVNQLNNLLVVAFAQGSQLGTPQVLTNTPQQRSIGGVTWAEEDVSFPLNNNASLHLVTISVQYKGHYYSLQFFADGNVFDEAMQKYYDPMLNSLKFLS